MKKKLAAIFLSCMLLFAGCGNGKTSSGSDSNKEKAVVSADYPSYDNFEKLAGASNLVIQGKVVSSEVHEMTSLVNSFEKTVYTINKIRITKSFKGNYKAGDEIEIGQIGGSLNGKNVISSDSIALKADAEYVFFLNDKTTPITFVTPYQGCYMFNSGTNEYASVAESNSLKLTEAELSKIK